jgi:isopenicillin-N N-acyltransferase-like protein
MDEFPQITISGTPFERGRQHGQQLREKIAGTIAYYRSIFEMSDAEIMRHARYFRETIQAFNPEYIEEIEGIALGAQVESLWVVALNARSEILSHQAGGFATECTALYFSERSILGQNWDWGRALESLTVLLKIVRPDGHVIKMLTEPGIIGKIGMNNSGLACCLNILTTGKPVKGLPVHVFLRAVLDCKSLSEVDGLLQGNAFGKASNVMVADAQGNGFSVEFCDQKTFRVELESGCLLHTNHYLGCAINSSRDPAFKSSFARYEKATDLLSESKGRGVASMCELLSNESNPSLPIYRGYVPDVSLQELGTVFTVVMDLRQQIMHIRKGNGVAPCFVEYRL